MDEMSGGGGLIGLSGEKADLVADARAAELADAQPGIDGIGIGQRLVEAAHGFDGEADHRPFVNVEAAGTDQVLVDDGVEEGIVDDVVDVPIEVVVHPSRGDHVKMRVVAAPLGGPFRHHSISRRRASVAAGCSIIIMWPASSSTSMRRSAKLAPKRRPSAAGVIRSCRPSTKRTGQRTDAAAAAALR